MLRLPPLHRRAECLFIVLQVGHAGTDQIHAQDRIAHQATGEKFSPQHAAQTDEDVIGGWCNSLDAAAVEQTQFDTVLAAHDPGLEMPVEKREETHEILAGAFQ
ncbi:hypothetical protein D3C71_1021240 [compost metagenome]